MKEYKLRFLPLFSQDLNGIVAYISDTLKNPQAALALIDQTEEAIQRRLAAPEAFEPYHSRKERSVTYYRLQVRNYYIFYIVQDDIMEVRRMLFARRDWQRKL